MSLFIDKYNGCLIGLAVGDAFGGPLEFSDRDQLCQFSELEVNYHFNFPKGYWYDDTAEMLCVSDSLIECRGFNLPDFLRKYHKFVNNGQFIPKKYQKTFIPNDYMRQTAIKIGLSFKQKSLVEEINPYDTYQLDCEPLTRIGPIVLVYYSQPQICIDYINKITKSTHSSNVCTSACTFYASLMIGALMGVDKSHLLSEKFNIMDVSTYGKMKYNKITTKYLNNCYDMTITVKSGGQVSCKSTKEHTFIRNLCPRIREIQQGSYKDKVRSRIQSDNHIVHCLEAVLWVFYSTETFEDGCIVAANLGDNSDTIAAVYGQFAGIYYGLSQIPEKWKKDLYELDEIRRITQQLGKLGDSCPSHRKI